MNLIATSTRSAIAVALGLLALSGCAAPGDTPITAPAEPSPPASASETVDPQAAFAAALAQADADAVTAAIRAGADPNGLPGAATDTPVAQAASRGQADVVGALIAGGADPTLLPTSTSWGPTHYAGYQGDIAVLEALAQHGVDLDIPDNDGYTALHFAAAAGGPETVQWLLDAGADPLAEADNGFTPHDSAVDRGQDDSAALLPAA